MTLDQIKIDEKDWKILDELKENARLSTYRLAKKTGIPVATVHNRLRRLQQEKIISRFTIDLNHKKLGLILTAFILIHYDISLWGTKSSRKELEQQMTKLPFVEEVKYTTGPFDILLKARLRSMDDLNDLLLDRIRKIPGIGKTETIFVLEDVK